MTLREKQKAKRKEQQRLDDEFFTKSGKRKPPATYEGKREKFYYDMHRMELKDQKIRDILREPGGAVDVDYDDITVTDEDFAEEEKNRFQKFLKERKEDKELSMKIYGDEKSLREKEGYDDDYIGSLKDELNHPQEEQERITDMLKRKQPELEKERAKVFKEHGIIDPHKYRHVLDEKMMDIEQTDFANTEQEMESLKLDLQEMENIYGKEQKIKDQYYKRRLQT